MKIAIFSDSFFPELGGIQDSIALAARELGKRGHHVQFHVPHASARDFSLSGMSQHEIDLGPNVSVHRHFSVHLPSPTNQSRFVIPTFRRWRQLREFGPDIIHTHTFFGLGWEAVHTARKLHVPLIGTNHSAIAGFSGYVPFARERFAQISFAAVARYYNACDFVSGPSRSVIEDMKAAGLRAPSQVVSNPIDTAVFHPVSKEERAALKKKWSFSEATVIYAGRFGIEKNIDVLIRALALAQKSIPEATLALAGHGSDEPRLKSVVSELGLGKSVHFLGTLSPQALAEAYQAADLFAIASTSETQSMVLLQAMNCGQPAVGADSLSLKEYIPERTGMHAVPASAEDFASKMKLILQNPELRARLSAGAVEFGAQFSPASIVGQWEEIYRAHLHGV